MQAGEQGRRVDGTAAALEPVFELGLRGHPAAKPEDDDDGCRAENRNTEGDADRKAQSAEYWRRTASAMRSSTGPSTSGNTPPQLKHLQVSISVSFIPPDTIAFNAPGPFSPSGIQPWPANSGVTSVPSG